MIDELAFRVLFELGKLAVAGLSTLVQLAVKGVSSLVSSNESTAAETPGLRDLSSDQKEALEEFNKLSDTDRNATRTLLLENLDTISQERSKNSSSTSQESTGRIVC